MAACWDCKKPVSDDSDGVGAVKCDICKNEYCSSCFLLSASEIKCLSLKKRSLLICCIHCKLAVFSSLLNMQRVHHLQKENALLQSTVKDKDIIICDKEKIIALLDNDTAKTSAPSNRKQTSRCPNISQPTLSPELISNAIKQAQESTVLDGHTNGEKGGLRSADKHNRSNLPNVIKGTNTSIAGLSAAVECKWFHAGNLGVDTSDEAVTNHLRSNLVNVISCEKLSSRNTAASSFKIAIQSNDSEKITNPDIWPTGVTV